MRHRSLSALGLCVMLLSLGLQPARAVERHALLIGISKYQHIRQLQGPEFDVDALAGLLISDWGFRKGNIVELTDAAATKSGITGALQDLLTTTKPGDQVFLYYSGHGTSKLDLEGEWPLPHTSGALIPVDFNPDGSIKEQMAQLIVGRWDIRPVIKQLEDGGRQIFAVVDACYSGNAVRGINSRQSFTPRYVRLRAPRSTSLSVNSGLDDLGSSFGQATRKKEPYPFDHTYFIAASGEHETAVEINRGSINRYPTEDGKLHGAFTDAMLRVLRNKAGADSNHNGILEYGELFRAIRDFMDAVPYPQTPRALPLVADDQYDLRHQPVFGYGGQTRPATLQPDAPRHDDDRLRVKTSGLPSLQSALSRRGDVRIVDDNEQLSIVRSGNNAQLLRPSGDMIVSLPASDVAGILQGVEQQLWVRALGTQANPNQRFNVTLDLSGDRQAGLLIEGEDVGLTVSTEQDAYIMLIDIDPAATATVLYPGSRAEAATPLAAGKVITIPDPGNPKDRIEVREPFGTDYIIALAFIRKPQFFDRLIGATVPTDSYLRPQLDAMVNSRDQGVARALLQVVTQGKHMP